MRQHAHAADGSAGVNRTDIAEEISAGYDVRETDPFSPGHTFGKIAPAIAPIAGRIRATWDAMRGTVLRVFPEAPGLPADWQAYLHSVDEIYQSDAYHSLSIEGYRVTPALIECVRSGDWSPESTEEDRKSRDALAARGYWLAFQLVKRAVEEVIRGANPVRWFEPLIVIGTANCFSHPLPQASSR